MNYPFQYNSKDQTKIKSRKKTCYKTCVSRHKLTCLSDVIANMRETHFDEMDTCMHARYFRSVEMNENPRGNETTVGSYLARQLVVGTLPHCNLHN